MYGSWVRIPNEPHIIYNNDNMEKREYIKPQLSKIGIVETEVLCSSANYGGDDEPKHNQCDCPQYDIWGGCVGCEGGCDCGGC